MSITLAIQTDLNRFLLMVTVPPYRPSILAWVILALALAVLGLAVDVILSAGPVGAVALLPATIAAGMVLGLLALEVKNLCAEPRF